MTERSWPWSTVAGLGDGAAELSEAYSREFLALYFGVQDPAVEGVCKGLSIGELEVSGVATPLSVDPGAAICYGLYVNDAVRNVVIATPAIGTTGGRVVLQTNWAGTGGAGLEARTRLAAKYSADGNPAIPALTQAFGTTWEISLATFTVTTGGVITLTDDRTFRRATAVVDTDELINLAVTEAKIEALAVTNGKIGPLAVTEAKIGALAVTEGKIGALAVTEGKIGNLAVTTGKIADNAVDNTKLRNSSGLSVIGKPNAGAGDPSDIVAAADDRVLSRAASALAFTQISTGMIANNAVDDTKVGNRVPMLTRRQGGDATDWDTEGTTDYTPTTIKMQTGSIAGTGGASGNINGTFPQAFSADPIFIVSCFYSDTDYVTFWGTSDDTNFQIHWNTHSGSEPAGNPIFHWLAIGPE